LFARGEAAVIITKQRKRDAHADGPAVQNKEAGRDDPLAGPAMEDPLQDPLTPVQQAAAAPVQMAEVTVSRGDRSEKEDTNRVENQGNQFEGETKTAWQKLKDALAAAPPVKNDILGPFYEMTPSQRKDLYLDKDTLLTKLLATPALTNGERMRVLNYCDFPLVKKLDAWYVKKGLLFNNNDLVKGLIFNAPMSQKMDVVKNQTVCTLLSVSFLGTHPENLFGDDFGKTYYPTFWDMLVFADKYEWYANWYMATAALKFDAEGKWAEIAGKADPAAEVAAIKGKPGNLWDGEILGKTPRGSALTTSMMANIKKIAFAGALAEADRIKLMAVRFNFDLTKPSGNLPNDVFQTLWNNFEVLPIGIVTSDLVTKMLYQERPLEWTCPDPNCPDTTDHGAAGNCPTCAANGTATALVSSPTGALGSYDDYATAGSGTVEYADPTQENPTLFGAGPLTAQQTADKQKELEDFGHTVRHEIGHQADTKLGGFTNFQSKAPAFWKKWNSMDGWLDSMLDYSNARHKQGFKALLSACMSGTPKGGFVNPYAGPKLKKQLWDGVAAVYDPDDLEPALKRLKQWGKHNADSKALAGMLTESKAEDYPSGNRTCISKHYFGCHYGEYYSYRQKAEEARTTGHGTSGYTLAHPAEFYADLFASYFAKKPRAGNVPGWAEGYFAQVEQQFVRPMFQDATGNKTSAEGGSLPTQADNAGLGKKKKGK